MPSEKVLIVDDEKLVRWSLRQKCEEWGYRVLEADNGAAALKVAHNESPDLVLLDVRLPDASGIDILEQVKKAGDARAIIMITADPQLEDVKTALKLGAYDFVGKPLDFDELAVAVKNALETTRLRTEVESLRGEVRRRAGYHNVIGVSAKMAELLGFVNKVAASEATTILVQGESGTGKDLIAKAIHYQSRRQDKPFVAINCSAIPETLMEAELFGHERGAFTDAKTMKKGLFEMADGGTLFLDEIGELSPLLQALVGSTQPDVAALAMRLLAAQARFARQISRMQWPLAELPGDLLHAVLAAWEAEGGATAAVREAYEEGHTRHALAARLVTMMGAGALAALLPGHAGVALFASAVAQGAQGARDLAVLAMQEGQKTRLALMLRAGGAPPATVEDALLALFGGSAEDAELARVGAEKAARLLTSGAATGAV